MVLNDNDSSWVAQRAQQMLCIIEGEYTRPSVVFKAKLIKVSPSYWRAYIGTLQKFVDGKPTRDVDGNCFTAIGHSPDEAMRNFDKAWFKKEGE